MVVTVTVTVMVLTEQYLSAPLSVTGAFGNVDGVETPRMTNEQGEFAKPVTPPTLLPLLTHRNGSVTMGRL